MVEPHIHFSVVNGFSSGPTAAAALGEFGRNAFIFHVKGEAYIATTAALVLLVKFPLTSLKSRVDHRG